MPSILELMGHVQQQAELGRQRGKESALGKLLARGYQQGGDRSQLLGQIAQVDPAAAPAAQRAFAVDDDARMQAIGNMAGLLVRAPEQARPGLYAGMVPQLQRMGLGEGLPPQWSDELLPAVEGIWQQLGGGRGAGTGVQSTFVDAQGNRIAIMRDGSTQVLGRNAPNNQIIDTGAGFFGVNKGNLQAAPVMVGGAPASQPQFVTEDGRPIPEDELPALRAAMAAADRGEDATFAVGGPTGAQQLRSVPKPPPPPTQLQINADARDAERLRLAQEAAARAGQPTPAQQHKIEQTRRKEQSMLAANDAQVDGTVKLIDQILASGRLEGVTGLGAPLSRIPGSPWADVAAKLDTLKGRSAFGALQQMRANSPTGGALGQVSERELYLLQNAETQLQDSQSPESLREALETYRAALLESKQRMHRNLDEFYSEQPGAAAPAGAGGVDDLLSKYGVN